MCRRTLLPGALMLICGLDFGTSNTTLGTMCRRPTSSKVTPSAGSARASPLRRFYDMGQGTEVSAATLFAEHALARSLPPRPRSQQPQQTRQVPTAISQRPLAEDGAPEDEI